jgi:hypothetical protein
MGFHIIHNPAANTAFLVRFAAFPSAGQCGGEVAKGPAFQSFSSAAAHE